MRNRHPLREHIGIFGPAVLVALLGFLLAYQFVDPAPPNQLTITTGEKDGAYYLFGQRYQEILSRERIQLEVRQSAGSIENIQRLEAGEAEVAFVQGGTGGQAQSDKLRSLGSLYFEPIWLFHRRDQPLSQLSQLRGKRIAVGAEGSGTRALTLQLLADNDIDGTAATLQILGGEAAADALIGNQVDAAFFVASPRSPLIRSLLEHDAISLMSFERADAYTRIHRYLSRVVLPKGVINFRRNLPTEETILLAASANLVVHEDLHPALIDLLLQAAKEVHGSGGWFEQSGEFPNAAYLDFPLGKEARRFYDYGPPLLQRYLPFWAATLIDRLKVMLLPLIALLLPLFKIMPPIYRWRMRSRIYRWYRELLYIDRQLYLERAAGDNQEQLLSELDKIEQGISEVHVPLSFAEELYDLRLHVTLVRERLEKRQRPEWPSPGDSV
jgi:TRAP transporter TAXI family solute receptor